MALSEASDPAPGSDTRQEALRNVEGGRGRRGLENGGGAGLSAEMVKEGNDPAQVAAKRASCEVPAASSGVHSRYDCGNVSARKSVRMRQSRDEDSKRDGFPRGFSTSSGLRKTVNSDGISAGKGQVRGEETAKLSEERGNRSEGEIVSIDVDFSKHIVLDFDNEQMGRDDSAVYGSAGEITPEIGSFRVGQENGGVESQDSDLEQARLDANLSASVIKNDDHKRHIFSRRKKSAEEKVAPVDKLPTRNGAKRDGFITSRLFAKPLAARDEYLSNYSSPSPDVRAQANNFGGPMGSFEITFDDVGDAKGWNNVFPRGDKPEPRHFHAAAVVGRRMVVVGGQTASGFSNDVQMLHLGRMTWSELGRGRAFANGQAENLKAATPAQLPPCRGHSLISWGKTVLLVGGQLNPPSERVEVWSFDLETQCWTKIPAKGEVPAARSGQSVTRAGSILIMFGGETPQGRKLNDLHILDLKSLMWLPLHTFGYGPTPRSKHCAAMYDDRFLLIFGGASKSKPLGDLFALDFETMEWSKMKTKGITPSPRSGHAGILIGDKWYIAGGETRGRGSIETLMLDVANLTWNSIAATAPNTAVANQGLSLVLVQRKEKTMLVAFGGKGSELSNQVQVLYIMPLDQMKLNGSSLNGNVEARDGQSNAISPYTGSGLSCACVDVAKTHLTPLAEEQCSSRSSPGNSPLTEIAFDLTGIVPLRRRYGSEKGSKYSNGRQSPEEILSRVLRETSSRECSPLQHYKTSDSLHADVEMRGRLAPITTRRPGGSSRRKGSFDSTLTSVLESAEYIDSSRRGELNNDLIARTKSMGSDRSLYTAVQSLRWEGEECSDSQLLADLQDAMTMERRIHLINKYRQSFEMKLSAAVRRSEQAEGQVREVLRGKEETEKSLASALKTRQHAEGKLAASLKAQTELKERVVVAERAQDDSNNLCNVVHSENLRLEHDLAFLKAVLEDTQKELQSTREVLATERARSFQLQMEVFDLKKKLPLSITEITPDTTAVSQLLPVSENACLVAPD